eukprot:5741834-Karenia_brevis.AAC.1
MTYDWVHSKFYDSSDVHTVSGAPPYCAMHATEFHSADEEDQLEDSDAEIAGGSSCLSSGDSLCGDADNESDEECLAIEALDIDRRSHYQTARSDLMSRCKYANSMLKNSAIQWQKDDWTAVDSLISASLTLLEAEETSGDDFQATRRQVDKFDQQMNDIRARLTVGDH